MTTQIEEFNQILKEVQDIPENFNEEAMYLKGSQQDALFEEYKKRELELIAKLNKIADNYNVTQKDITMENWVKIDQIGEYQFSSQGMGALRYAEINAKQIAHRYESFGIPAKIEFIKEKEMKYYAVYGECSYDLMIMLKYKKFDIEEDIENLEKMGANIRVFYPFLPYDKY